MMKKLFLLTAVTAIMVACTPKHDGYTITGTITGEGLTDGKAYIANSSRTDPQRDTADFIGGEFIFKNKLVTPENYSITIDGLEGRINIALENTTYTITATASDLQNAAIAGGVMQSESSQLIQKRKDINDKYNMTALMQEYREEGTTDERKAEIRTISETASSELAEMEKTFHAGNPRSFIALAYFNSNIDKYDQAEADTKIAELKALPEFAGNRMIKEAEDKLNVLKSLIIGQPAPQFTLNDPDGNPIAFKDVFSKNKLTMIDFWAGWCGPCRQFNPKLVEIHKKFKPLGFDILGVSLDHTKQSWIDAIAADKLEWTHVSDLKYWESEAAKMYYIRFIPQSAFVDQDGILVHRDAGQDTLEDFLKEYFNVK